MKVFKSLVKFGGDWTVGKFFVCFHVEVLAGSVCSVGVQIQEHFKRISCAFHNDT